MLPTRHAITHIFLTDLTLAFTPNLVSLLFSGSVFIVNPYRVLFETAECNAIDRTWIESKTLHLYQWIKTSNDIRGHTDINGHNDVKSLGIGIVTSIQTIVCFQLWTVWYIIRYCFQLIYSQIKTILWSMIPQHISNITMLFLKPFLMQY